MTKALDYSFGAWIRHRRKTLDLTQPELAERLHCSVNTIKKLETDARRPSKQLAELLAAQLHIPEEHQLLFIDCARGLRPIDALQRLDAGRPAIVSVHPTRLKPDSAQAPVSSIIGRATELAALRQLMKDSRLVTITGPGGMGKSFLAQAVVADYEAHGLRAVFVPLVGLDSADHIPLAVLWALGFTADTDPKQQIFDYVRPKRILLVFDNFEHLLEGATFLSDILQAAADASILSTSRERLRLSGEQVFPLRGLRFPEHFNSGELSLYPAANLFLAAARKLIPDFEPADQASLVQICQITEGVPLALEMSAAWADKLSLSEIVAELQRNLDILVQENRQVAPRHRSMRAVFESSWQRLENTQRDVFSKLCIFRGGFTRQAAEALSGANPMILSGLINRSIIRLNYASGRYSIHELLRRYGEEYLDSMGWSVMTQQEHLMYFLEQAETAQLSLHKAEQIEWFNRLDEEQDNLRAALSFALAEPEQVERAVRLVLALCWYWRIRSRVTEARRWVEPALQIKSLSIENRARLEFHAGHFGWMQNDLAFARFHQQLSLQAWQSLGVDGINGAAYSYLSLGMIADLEQSYAEAVDQINTSIRLFTECHDDWGAAFARHRLGATLLAMGDLNGAHQQFVQAEQFFRSCGDRWALGLVLGLIARVEFQQGEFSLAREFAEEAHLIRAELGHTHSVIDSLDLLARIALQQRDKETARRFVKSAIDIAAELGNQQFLTELRTRHTELTE